jgi:hypothetical protein
MMADIYIAYDNTDEAVAAQTASLFEQQAIAVCLRANTQSYETTSHTALDLVKSSKDSTLPSSETEKALELAILEMIEQSRCLVVIVSHSSVNSGALFKEVNYAFEQGKELTVLQLEDVVLKESIKKLLSNCQWFDARENQLNQAITALISSTTKCDKQQKLSSESHSEAIDDTKLPAAKPSLRVSIIIVIAIAIWGYWSSKNDSGSPLITKKQSIESSKD